MMGVAGQNVMHQAPTMAKRFHFVAIEDENGFMNVIVRLSFNARYRKAIRHLLLLMVEGNVQRAGAVTNVLCDRTSQMPLLS